MAYANYNYQQKHFGKNSRSEMFIVEETITTHGAISKSTLLSAFDLHDAVYTSSEFQALCVTQPLPSTSCAPSSSIFLLWNNDKTLLAAQTQQEILQTITTNLPNLPLNVFLGELEYDASEVVSSSSALQIILSVIDNLENEKQIINFKEDFLNTCFAMQNAFSTEVALFCQAAVSYSAESDRAIKGDQILMSFEMILMIGYVA